MDGQTEGRGCAMLNLAPRDGHIMKHIRYSYIANKMLHSLLRFVNSSVVRFVTRRLPISAISYLLQI